MMNKRIVLLTYALLGIMTLPSYANWQNPGNYIPDTTFDDGARFVLSARGGISWGSARVKNGLDNVAASYYYDTGNQLAITSAYWECYNIGGAGCTYESAGDVLSAGYGNLGGLSAHDNFSKIAFVGGASIGALIPYHPQWRIEASWDHISEMEYNASPLFSGRLALSGDEISGVVVNAAPGAVQSKLTSDIFSAMVYYDFFNGMEKPLNTVIPYIGFGVGYADSVTELQISDPYGDFSSAPELANYGIVGNDSIVQFYSSSQNTTNIAGLLALGLSYGVAEYTYLDLGVRFMYIPSIKWSFANEDDSEHRTLFKTENMFFTNFTLGVRVEF